MKKHVLYCFVSLFFVLSCFGLDSQTHDTGTGGKKTEVVIAAAASLANAMNELIALYAKVASDVIVIPTYGASGALQKQIEQGAPVDVFFSAAPKHMDALSAQGLVLKDTRRDVLMNDVVLIVPTGKTGITGFADIAGPGVKQIALGEPASVPVGQYAEQVFTWLKILDAVKSKVIYAKDVRQVLTYVESAEVDAGVVYATDAALSKKVTLVAKAPEVSHAPVLYPVAVVSTGNATQKARFFVEWLGKPEAAGVFTRYGFAVKKDF